METVLFVGDNMKPLIYTFTAFLIIWIVDRIWFMYHWNHSKLAMRKIERY